MESRPPIEKEGLAKPGQSGRKEPGQETPKGRPRGAQRSPREPEVAHFVGSQVTKKQEKRKRGFSKTELSFETGAHFERGGAKGRPRGAQGVHK